MATARMTIALLVGSLTGSAGAAAQTPAPGSGAGGFQSRFIPLDVLLRMQEQPEGVKDAVVIPTAVDPAWSALEASLEELGVPVGFADQKAGEIGTPQVKLFRRMGKERLSTYLRCGSGLTGPNADSYAVYLALVVFVRQVGEGEVTMQPLVAAQAVDVAGGRNDAVNCTSTGKLERRITDLVKLKVLNLK